MRKPHRRGPTPGGAGAGGAPGAVGGGVAVVQQPHMPCAPSMSPSRELVGYTPAPTAVEVDLDGRLHRIGVTEPLTVIADDDLSVQYGVESCGKKDHREQVMGVSPPTSPNPKKFKKEGGRTPCRNKNGGTMSVPHPLLPRPIFRLLPSFQASTAPPLPAAYYRFMEHVEEEEDRLRVEYDMDEEDMAWLELVNGQRRSHGVATVTPDTFELLLDRLELESWQVAAAGAQEDADEDAFCCVCLDDECLNSNAILFCDACNLAVHQECYGVPYIPEGPWLCRRCLQSPSRPVDCVLCPNRGGAFKQTSDGRWAHVACAIWIPEVCFANTVFLEPVEGVANIPPARWRLTCYLCKQKGRGAAIQCQRPHCYTAFHVTCAQSAGLHMHIDTVRETGANGTAFSVRKTAFCGSHSPAGSAPLTGKVIGRVNGLPRMEKQQQQQKKKNKQSQQVKEEVVMPLVVVPAVPTHRLTALCSGIRMQRKMQFVQQLHSYWLLKRRSRGGVPLIRRLQSHSQPQHSVEQKEPNERVSAVLEELRYWQKLRQDMEKVRLLLELMRKREKLKREQIRVQQAALELQLTPALVLLRATLEQLQEQDMAQIFQRPVDIQEVPDYLDFVSQPMDFSTMRSKLEAHGYLSLGELEADFQLMLSNCLHYNARDTVFHRAALQLRDLGGAVLRHAQRQARAASLDPHTGMHLQEPQHQRAYFHCSWEEVDALLLPENRLHLSHEEQLKELLEKLEEVTALRPSGARTKRVHLLRREIRSIRRKRSRPQPVANGSDEEGEEEEEEELGERKSDGCRTHPKCLSPGDIRCASPPTLEAVSHSLPMGDAPQDPPTLCPVLSDVWPAEPPPNELKPASVGRRTSVLFRKARNGARVANQPPVLTPAPPTVASPLRHNGKLGNGEDAGPPKLERSEGLTTTPWDDKGARRTDGAPPVKQSRGKPTLSKALRLDGVRVALAGSGSSVLPLEKETKLQPLDLVWAKCRGYPSYPALVVDPDMPQEGLLHNGVPIPVPPQSVLKLGEKVEEETGGQHFLVLFFDNKRTWQWLPREKLVPLGLDDMVDKLRLIEGRKPSVRKSVQVAYDRALLHLTQVRGEHAFVSLGYL